jgi:hypothetical protein
LKVPHYYVLLRCLDFTVIIAFLFPKYVQTSSDIRKENSLKTWNMLETDERVQSCSKVTK